MVHRAGLRPGGLAFGPNNRLYVLGSSTGMYGFHALHCFNATTGAEIWSGGGNGIFTGIAVGPNDDLYVSRHYPHGVLQFNAETGKLIGPLVRLLDHGREAKE